MMYLVDLTSLPVSERTAAVEKIRSLAWETYDVFDKYVLVSVKVMWNRKEDFQSSPVFPRGCSCIKLGN